MDVKNILSLPTAARLRPANPGNGRDLTAVGQKGDTGSDPRLRHACREMESLFIGYLLKEMRATIDKSGFISGGQAEEIFTSLLDVELSREMSAGGGIGLSAILMQQLGSRAEKDEGV